MHCFFLQRYKYFQNNTTVHSWEIEFLFLYPPKSFPHLVNIELITCILPDKINFKQFQLLLWFDFIFLRFEQPWFKIKTSLIKRTKRVSFLLSFIKCLLNYCFYESIYVSQAKTNRLFFFGKSIWFLKDNH